MKGKIIILLIVSVLICQSCGQKKNSESANSSNSGGMIATAEVDYETYLEMRNALLDINPAEFGMKKSDGINQVFGIIMDLNQGDSVVTVSAYKTGDISVYSSSGMLYMGGVQVPRFKNMALDFVSKSQKFISLSKNYVDKNLPESGFVKFYFITNNGIYEYQDELVSINQDLSDWTVLIETSKKIVDEYVKAINN